MLADASSVPQLMRPEFLLEHREDVREVHAVKSLYDLAVILSDVVVGHGCLHRLLSHRGHQRERTNYWNVPEPESIRRTDMGDIAVLERCVRLNNLLLV